MEDAVSSSLFEAFNRSVHGLSGGSEGASGQHLDLLGMSDFSVSVDDFLSGLLQFLGEVSKLQYFSFDEGVSQLLHGSVDDVLVGLSEFENALAKGIKGELRTIAGSCAQFNREHRVSSAHGEVGPWASVVEYKSHVFGLAFIVVGVIDGRCDAKPSIGSILDERWSWVHIARGVVDDILVCTSYHDRRRR